jgi:hypothetical protein
MLARLDAFPDALGQAHEMFGWWGDRAEEREDDKIRDIARKAYDPHGERQREQLRELNEILYERAKRQGIEPEKVEAWTVDELKRVKAKANG